jgi:hypothetical protein
LRHNFPNLPGRWRALSLAAVLFLVNAYIARELFTTEYTVQMGSIEASFISIAHYILGNWRDLTWFPLWYGGIPFQNTYPPLLHLLVASVAGLLRISPALSYHAVTATFYCLGPVTFFWLALKLTGSRGYSFAAGLLYSVFSPSALLIPAVRNEVGGLFNPRRFQALVQFGEGPHVASLTLLPVAIICLAVALEKRRPLYYLLAALSMAAVVLTNWLGGFALAAAVVAYLLALPRASQWKEWLTAVAIGAYAYVLAVRWIPPSTIAAIRANEKYGASQYTFTLQNLKYVGLVLIALVFVGYCLDRWKAPALLRFSAIFTLFMASLVLGSAWFGIILMPQPDRYHLELEMALSLLAIFMLRPLLDRMGPGRRTVILSGFLVFAFFQMKTYRGFAKYQDRPIDIHSTVEYEAARWLDTHVQGQRVFVPGSVEFWLNAFSYTPQFGGGFYQGATNPYIPHVMYQVYSGAGTHGNEGEVGALWLKAFGIHAVMTGGPRSREFFKDFRNPAKFEGRFKEVWRDGDDAIYQIPWRSASLAHVVRPQDLVPREIVGALDVEPLRPYVAALDDPSLPVATFAWRNRHRATITANLDSGQVISVQISYHPGWHATVGGQKRRLIRDHLSQIEIEPECQGPCTVELTYDGGLEMLLARIASWSALLAGLIWVGWSWRRR